MKGLRALILAGVALVVAAPTVVWGQMLNDSEEPGSVIVFPKFLTGTVDSGDGTQLPRSDFEISVTCPTDIGDAECNLLRNDPLFAGIFAFTMVTIHFHWVCPGTGPAVPLGGVCPETDFKVRTTIFGTVHINPENLDPKTHIVTSPPPCPAGYLIGWVENDLGLKISWNSLIGDAIIRPSPVTEVWAYNAIPIQATGKSFSAVLPADGTLPFNGTTGYKAVTGKIFGTVRYEDSNTQTFLTLLTLDVDSNRFNRAVDIDLEFYNEHEDLASTATHFTCWEEVELTSLDSGLTTSFGTKGLVRSVTPPGPTLLGIIDTHEAIPNSSAPNTPGSPDPPLFRGYAYSLFNDSVPVPTTFQPHDPNSLLDTEGIKLLTPVTTTALPSGTTTSTVPSGTSTLPVPLPAVPLALH
jgi:hypothetical protein